MSLNVTQGTDINDFRGGNRPPPGRYHVLVRNVEEVTARSTGNPGFEFELEVLAGTVPGQEGKSFKHTAWNTSKSQDQLISMAIATGILVPGKPANEGGECEPEDLLSTEHAQLVVDIEEDTYTDKNGQEKKTIKVAYGGIWPVGHKDVAHLKINQAAYDLWKSGNAPATAAANNNGDDSYGDL